MSKERILSLLYGSLFAAASAVVGYLARELGLSIPPLNVIGAAVRGMIGGG